MNTPPTPPDSPPKPEKQEIEPHEIAGTLSDDKIKIFAERLVALRKEKDEKARQANLQRHREQLGMGLYLQSLLQDEEAEQANKDRHKQQLGMGLYLQALLEDEEDEEDEEAE